MAKPWLQHYPSGVPAEIDMDEFSSLVDVFEKSVQRFRDRPAFSNMGASLTYGELNALTIRFAAYLQQDLGLQPGDRIALMMPNILQYPVALFGALRAGLTVVNVNPLYTGRELSHQLNDSGAVAILIVENFCCTLQKVIKDTPVKHVIVTALGDLLPFPKRAIVNFVVRHIKKIVPAWSIDGTIPFREALAKGAARTHQPTQLNHEHIAFLQYTGGTTGVAKGAVLTHGNMVANLQQASAWLAVRQFREGVVIVTALPLYHIFSLTANCLTFIKMGGCNLLITNPRDIPGFIKTLKENHFDVITGVNTLFNALLNHPDFATLDFSHLICTLGGGMSVQHVVAEKWQKITGCTLIEAYGLTETCPAAVINPMNLDHFSGFIGLPISSTEVVLRDADGAEVPLGEPGELCIRGPQVMRGYWNRPQETADVLGKDGFLATGDIAIQTADGYLKLVDRKKDMILVSGFNVYPNEVEDVLAAHPDILEVAVIGLPDHASGEQVVACIVPRHAGLTAEAVIAFARESLTGYKIPHQVIFMTEVPKSNVGKILRRELRMQFAQK